MNYELVYIMTPKLSDEDAEKKVKEINEIVKKESTEIILEDFWGKKELAYPIQKLEHGYYMLVQFKAGQENILKIDKKLKLIDEIIRHLIVRRDVLAPMKKEETEAERAAKAKKDEEKITAEAQADTEAPKEEAATEIPKETEKTGEDDKKEAAKTQKEKGIAESLNDKKKEAKADISDLDSKIDDILKGGIED